MKVTVRTLDSQSYEFDPENEEITVKEFKELILPKVNVAVDKQRLIFHGKVLHDDKKIKEYGVDGCVIHLVERAPPPPANRERSQLNVSSQQSSNQNVGDGGVPVYIGALNTSADNLNGVAQHLVDSLVSQFGAGNVSASQRGNSLNVNINVHTQNSERSDVQNRIGTARRFLSHAEHLLRHVSQATHQSPSQCTCNDEQQTSEDTERMDTTSTTDGSENDQNTQQESSSENNETSPQALGHEFDRFQHFYQHLQPHLQRYSYLLNNPQAADRSPSDDLLSDQMAEIFHDFSHMFHALSDLSFNFNSPSPQSLMCYPQMSPVRFPPPMPHVHMSTSTTGNQRAQTPATSNAGVPTGQPGNISGRQPVRQRTPVAVAAVSTVVQVPVMQYASSSHTQSTTPTVSSSPTTSVGPHPMQSMFGPIFSNSPFPSPHGGNSSIQVGVISGNNGATQTFNIGQDGLNQGQGPPGGQLPFGLQNIMQNIMQNMAGGSTAQPTNPTMTSSVTSSTETTMNSQPQQPQSQHQSTHNAFHQSIHQAAHQRAHQAVQQRAHQAANQATLGSARHSTHNHRPHPHHHHHNQDGSVMHPDMLLPCHSFHFGPTFFHGNNMPGEPHVVAEVSSIVIDGNGRPVTTSNGATTSHSTTETSTANLSNTAGVPNMRTISDMLSGVFGASNNVADQTEPRIPVSNDNNTMDVDGVDSQEILRDVHQMFQAFMGGHASGISPPNERETLRDFVRQNFGLLESRQEDLLTDFIDMLADNLTMHDLIGLFMGTSTEAWARLHAPFRQLIEKHFNDNARLNESNIPEIAQKIADSMGETYTEAEGRVTVHAEVDLEATLRSLDVQFFKKLLQLLLNDTPDFSRNIREWYVDYTTWSFAVLDYSVTGGADRFMMALVDSPSVRSMFDDMSASVRHLALQTLVSRIRSASAGRHITSSELISVLIKPGAKATVRKNPYKGTGDDRAAKRTKKNDDKVDVNERWEENNPGFELTAESEPGSPSSPEDWHSRVPSDWVVIINRDGERQRSMPPQRPYSDAYLSGLPPKRRKMMTRHSAEADRIDVNECVKTAVERTDVERKHDVDELKKEIEDNDLQAMFDTTFRHDVRRRLQEDDDYRPKQHPNTEKYFMKEKK